MSEKEQRIESLNQKLRQCNQEKDVSANVVPDTIPGMRKFRIDQDFLIEHWHMIYMMPVVSAEIYL